jgi:OOP family OmpA-OmpF porin
MNIVTQYSDWLFDGPEGRGFSFYLAQGYRRYAKHEDNANDFEDAAKFLHRAGAVERGERIEPEQLHLRILPVWAVDDLVYARQRLMRALSLGAAERLPKIAANAQVAFDCWMEQQEENTQPHDVARCRKDFEGFIVRLEYPPVKLPAPLPAAPECMPLSGHQVKQAAPAPAPSCSKNVDLFFELDRHDITEEGRQSLQEAMAHMRSTPAARLELRAHADRSGSDQHNEALSRRRLNSTVAALQQMGLPLERITIARHYGETRPRVPTPDGVREAANRRVEMHVLCSATPSVASTDATQCQPVPATR